VTEDINDQLQSTTHTIFNLAVNLGLIASVIGQYPEHVQEGFVERLQICDRWAQQMIEEVQAFGEAYDDQTEEGEDN
jgi:hypothetical protein